MLNRCLVSLTACCALSSANLGAQQRAPAPCDQYQVAVSADPKSLEAAVSLGRRRCGLAAGGWRSPRKTRIASCALIASRWFHIASEAPKRYADTIGTLVFLESIGWTIRVAPREGTGMPSRRMRL